MTANAALASDEEAQRRFDRGMAALEMASSRSGYESAAAEFAEATRLAPEWPEAHYNLGLVREKLDDLEGAMASLRRYLELAPQAADAAAVRSQVNKLEYRRDKLAEQARIPALLEGTWHGYMSFCGGNRSELRFYSWGNGQVSVELPVNWNANPGVATDPQKIAVTIEGQDIRFSFRSRLLVPPRYMEFCDVRYELKLAGPGELKGVIKQKNAPDDRIVNLKKQ